MKEEETRQCFSGRLRFSATITDDGFFTLTPNAQTILEIVEGVLSPTLVTWGT